LPAHPAGGTRLVASVTFHFWRRELGEPLLDRPAGACAAMPLRSEPEEAAVGEVFGTLAVVVAVIFTRSSGDAELLGHHLRHLDEQPLPHLGAAVVQVHRAVGVDVHQRAGLVEVDQRERDAELHRRQRDALLQDAAACGVEGAISSRARGSRVCAPARRRCSGRMLSSTVMP
jgi:hypothetical protein